MTSDEFWHGSPGLATAYRKAFRINQQNQYMREWRQGLYMREALLSASPAFREISKGINHDYPKEPLFSIEVADNAPVDENKRRMEQMKARFELMARAANKKLAEGESTAE